MKQACYMRNWIILSCFLGLAMILTSVYSQAVASVPSATNQVLSRAYADEKQPLGIGVFTTDRSSSLLALLHKHYGDSNLHQVIDKTGNVFSEFPDQQKIMFGPSLDEIRNSIISASQLPQKPDYIVYDIEHWPLTPEEERIDPVASISTASREVHSAGYKFGTTPDRSFLINYYEQIDWKEVDLLVMQMQRAIGELDEFAITVEEIKDHVKASNNNTQVMVELSLVLSDPDKIINAIDRIRNSVDGIVIVYLPGQGDQCLNCTLGNLDRVLSAINNDITIESTGSDADMSIQEYHIRAGDQNFSILLKSNSSILDVSFSESEKKMILVVDGADGSLGFTRIEIPTTLLTDIYKVLIDSTDVPIKFYNGTSSESEFDTQPDLIGFSRGDTAMAQLNDYQSAAFVTTYEDYSAVELSYHHSQRSIVIVGANAIPEFSALSGVIVNAGIILAILLSITFARKKHII